MFQWACAKASYKPRSNNIVLYSNGRVRKLFTIHVPTTMPVVSIMLIVSCKFNAPRTWLNLFFSQLSLIFDIFKFLMNNHESCPHYHSLGYLKFSELFRSFKNTHFLPHISRSVRIYTKFLSTVFFDKCGVKSEIYPKYLIRLLEG